MADDFVDEKRLQLLEGLEISAGGQSSSIQPCRLDGKLFIFKRYSAEVRASQPAARLAKLVRWRLALGEADRRILDERMAWVRHLVRKDGQLQGVLIPLAPGKFWHWSSEARPEPRSMQMLAHQDEWAQSQKADFFSVPQSVARLGHLLQTINFLHERDVVIGDIQVSNVLINGLSSRPATYVVDCDAVLLDNQWTLPPAESELMRLADWPEVLTRETDLFKFALLTLWSITKNIAPMTLGPEVGNVLMLEHSRFLARALQGPTATASPPSALDGMAMVWLAYVHHDDRRETFLAPNDLRPQLWTGEMSHVDSDDGIAEALEALRPPAPVQVRPTVANTAATGGATVASPTAPITNPPTPSGSPRRFALLFGYPLLTMLVLIVIIVMAMAIIFR